MRILFLIVASTCIVLAPAIAVFDTMPLGILGGEADAIRERIVDGMAAAAPETEPVQRKADTRY